MGIAVTNDTSRGDQDPKPTLSQGFRPEVSSKRLVLLVEDNRADVFLVERAVQTHQVPAQLHVVEDGEEALAYLASAETGSGVRPPDVLLLDLNLPKKSGTEVLQWLRRSERLRNTPVIVITSSDSLEDRREAARLGITHYFRKPTSYTEFLKIGEVLNQVLQGKPV